MGKQAERADSAFATAKSRPRLTRTTGHPLASAGWCGTAGVAQHTAFCECLQLLGWEKARRQAGGLMSSGPGSWRRWSAPFAHNLADMREPHVCVLVG